MTTSAHNTRWVLASCIAGWIFGCSDADDGTTIESPSPTTTSSSTSEPMPSSEPPPCEEGAQESCPCQDGSMAVHMCQGGVFGPCACPLPPEAWNLLGCFTRADGYDTCDVYCRERGRTCAAESCGADGALTEFGYTWVSWPAAEAASCETLEPPDQYSFDSCTTPIWLQPTKADDDVVRCCCD